MLPVIHAAAPKVTVVEGIAEWLNQVQPCPGECTEPAHVARILWNLRLKENDLKGMGHQGLEVVFDGSLGFADIDRLFQVIPLVILLFSPTEAQFHLYEAILEIHA